MDRSQEKGSSSKAKLQTLDQDKLPYIEGRNGIEGVNTRKNEPLMQSYLNANTPGAGMGLSYMANPNMDPRGLGSYFYGYNPQMISFAGYPGIYDQRLANGEDLRENRSSTSTPADRSDSTRDPKEPVRTESVIKIATDRPDSRKQEPVDKRQSRPSSDEYARQYTDRNGEPESSRNNYRVPRDKLDGPMTTPNGDLRNTTSKQMTETSSSERTIGAFGSYPTPSVHPKSLTPGSHPGDYVPKSDYSKTVTTSSNMYASMPKLTPIAPRGFSSPNFPASSAAEITERLSMSGSVWRPPSMGFLTRDYPLTSASEALASHRSSAGESSSRTDETPEARGSYLPHAVHESSSRENFATRERHFPYAWERNTPEISARYPGHSAYQGYYYGRTFQPKRPNEKETFKETEDVRSRTSDSMKESSISPDRFSAPRYTKEASNVETNKNPKEQTSQNYKSTVTTQQDVSSRNQTNLSKNEKPVVPENVRYKVKDERKCVLKSDKVTVYPRQGQAYVVSVRETPQKVSDYFSNGRLPNSDITTVSSDSNERAQLPSSYEPANKKDEGQRHGSIREGAVKGSEKNAPESTPGGDYPRRPVDASNNDRSISVEETKKINDRNNNSAFGAYQFPGYPSQGERPRASNRITLSQDKVFVPPNATLEMFEKRELEMERAAASCRSADAARITGSFGSNVRQKQPGRKENEVDVRNHSPEHTTPRIASIKPENKGSRSDVSSKSSDDEELKIIEEKTDSQQRNIRAEEKRLSSSPRLSRITSPVATTSSTNNPPYLTPFGVNFASRRTQSDTDAAAATAYMYAANMPYQANSPYLGSNVRPEIPVVLPMDPTMFYSGLYKQHMMDPSQGGAVMQDPLTGSLVVVPEALINANMFSPLAAATAAESQLMLDPARFWGMHASMEDPRWQQLYQQQKQLYEHQLENYKHDMMIAQQQGRWQGYALHPFYQKPMEAQRKEENERSLRTAEQRPKSREGQSNQPRSDKTEDSIPKEKKSSSTEERFLQDARRDDLDNRRDLSKIPPEFQGESRGVTSYPDKQEKVLAREPVKPPLTEYSEARDKAKEILQQEEQDRLFQQYMKREPVYDRSKFPFTRIPTSLTTSSSNPKSPLEIPSPRDRVRDLRENSRGEPTRNPETSRAEMSPQVVSAAATLANMDFGTRFPFNQQTTMPIENSNVSRGVEQLDGTSKRSLTNQNISREEKAACQTPAIGKSTTDNKPPQPIVYSSQQLYSPTKTITAVTVAPSTMHERREKSTDSSASEKGNFEILKNSFVRESTRTKSNSISSQNSAKIDYHSNGEEECSRLLVAKAEKLPQDEELEVIRIDTPYAFVDFEHGNGSTVHEQETDLLMSLSKVANEEIESPSSKSEIFWVACSDEEIEDVEVRTINLTAKPMKSELEGHNKENYFKLSLQNSKSEDEKKCIREKIEKLREVAKNRTREERFTALTRQKELKSPASIVHSVTSSLNEVLDMNVLEKDIRMRLADLQKKYREKHRELTRLQPRCKEGNDEGGGKNTPVKRGPGRPRKRKYFGASSKSGKTTPTLLSNGSLDFTTKSGASSPSSCPQSPGLKSITSEENLNVKDEPAKKKRKKSNNVKAEERVPTLPSPPQIASPIELELKPPRVKPSKKTPIFTAKTKIPTSTVITTTTSNMAKLISAISPSMLDDSSNVETESESSTTDLKTIPSKTIPSKTKPKKTRKAIKREKLPSTEESIENKEKMSTDSVKETCGSPPSIKIKKIRNPKKAKKKEKQSTTPKTDSEFVFPATNEKVGKKCIIEQEFTKPVGSEIDKSLKVERESNGDSSENDEVFTACHGGGALDMLADFASSASFEKEKEPEKESPFEVKGSKRGRPKKPSSPTPEADTTPTSKKKKKKKKPSTSSTKSSKKSSTTSEEKENDFTNREVEQQSPTQIPQEKTELKELPKPEVLEEQIEKVPELREEMEDEETEAVPESESVTPPEPIKEKRRKSRSSSVKELDDSKSSFALFGDWQPRRSERIFINSSVAPPSSADLSPLSSPTVKSSEFGWPKKTKRLSKGKKLSKTDSFSDVEPTEDEATPTSSKPSTKQKKKKSPAKGKKRRSSSVTDPDFVLRTPKRKAAKRDRSYEEADEDDDEDMADEEEDDYQEDIEEDTEQTSRESQDEIVEEDRHSNKPENETIDTADLEMKDEEVENRTAMESSSDGAKKVDNISAGVKERVSESETIAKEPKVEENTGLQTTKKESKKGVEKEVSVKKDKEEKPDEKPDEKESNEEVERIHNDKETFSKKENQDKEEQEKSSDSEKNETLPCEEEPTLEMSKGEQSSSDELVSVSLEKKVLPPEPVISFTKEELKENTKMLLPVDRVFYRGRIAFYQDPDLYGIVLPGERRLRPHLRSTEQLLSQAVKDVIPPAIEYLPIGTRVCAQWSPQYRCFYPGSVIETPTDEKSETGKLWVEFDDGDSGIFPLSDLRKIKTQYPVQVDDVESDVVVPERRPRSSSRATSPSSTRRSKDQETSLKNKDEDTSGWESADDAPIKKARGRSKRRVRLSTRDRRLSEEATDSDPPRGSRDSDFEDNVETSKPESRTKAGDKDYEAEAKSSQVKVTKRVRRRIKNRDDITKSSQDKSKDTRRNTETSENAKRDLKTEKYGRKHRERSKLSSNIQKQDEDSDVCDDNDVVQDTGTSRSRSRSSRLSELDLRKKSLTLNLNTTSSSRSGNMDRDSPMQDSTSQDEDSGSCSEVFDESPQMENKGFKPRLGKRRRSQLDKLRQDKSQGELWQWSGKNYQNKRKGKGRKVFYKTIVRGDETISVGDCAVFTSNPSKSNNLPYVGMIENMWEGCSGNMVVKVKWFYHPEETKAGRRASDAKHSLYRSTHVDENDIQTISHKCEVVSPEELKRRTQSQETIGTRSSTNDRSERLFCCVGTYDPSTEKIETS